tara:strand:+ start:1259 stop:1588 length:330 start_codon:yes stop_codon:yes gene_type:complete
MKYIHVTARFNKDSNEDSKEDFENNKLRELGIDVPEETTEPEYYWLPFSFNVEEVFAFNALDEYKSTIRFLNGLVYVVDLDYEELVYIVMPWRLRMYYLIKDKLTFSKK